MLQHRKAGDKPAAGEGFVAAPGDGLVSERYVNVTSTHEETESAREEEEIHPLGDGAHQVSGRHHQVTLHFLVCISVFPLLPKREHHVAS